MHCPSDIYPSPSKRLDLSPERSRTNITSEGVRALGDMAGGCLPLVDVASKYETLIHIHVVLPDDLERRQHHLRIERAAPIVK